MCPDEELLSAYLDGEVPSPWKERIEERLEQNPDCREELRRLSAVRTFLHQEPTPDFVLSQKAVWDRLSTHDFSRRTRPIWRRRVSVPVPLAAAAAALFLLLSGTLLWYNGRATVPAAQLPIAAGEIDLTVRIGDVGIDELLRMINESEHIGEVKVQLPESARFHFLGEPQLVRAADFRAESPLLLPHTEAEHPGERLLKEEVDG